jgi:hypothetical protein
VQSHSAPLAVLAGILDALGNVLFVLAAHSGRLDIAAILSSLYQAATVGLSVLVLRDRVARIQTIGVLFVLLAISVISAKAISCTLWTSNLYFWTHFASKARNRASQRRSCERESGLLRTQFASAHGQSSGKATLCSVRLAQSLRNPILVSMS